MTIQYGAEKMRLAFRMLKVRAEEHALVIFNNYLFSTATIKVNVKGNNDKRTRFNIRLYVHCWSC
jgi:hypothetical protein